MKATISFRFAAFEITADLGQEIQLTSDPSEQRKIIATAMYTMVQAAHTAQNWSNEAGLSAYLTVPIQNQPAPQPVIIQNQTPETKTEHPASIVVPVIKVSHGMDKNTEVFKVYGGNFTKWGVIAYKDSCVDKVGLFDKPFGEHPTDKPMLATIQMRGRDPYRVTEIVYNG